ncbi:MAG TPA: hypothetical protein VKK79_18915 [Candidatus Lokiarchaeia archaeon]|nr:hypothetical protein [Candidatus Lokiarchaeia archaeon]
MPKLLKWEHLTSFRFDFRRGFEEEETDLSFSSKPRLIATLCRRYYACLPDLTAWHLDGSEHSIVPVLAGKPYGTSSWAALEDEMLSFIRPSTFAQKLSSLEGRGLVFAISPEGSRKKRDRTLVIPDEILPQVRHTFKLAPQLPKEDAPDFGIPLSAEELEEHLLQIPGFVLTSPSPEDVVELAVTKDTGKTGVLHVPATVSFRDLHYALQTFAGWHDDHLHEFVVEVRAPERNFITIDGLDPLGKPVEALHSSEFREDQVQVGQILSMDNRIVHYLYDFGSPHKVVGKVTRVLSNSPAIISMERTKGELPN